MALGFPDPTRLKDLGGLPARVWLKSNNKIWWGESFKLIDAREPRNAAALKQLKRRTFLVTKHEHGVGSVLHPATQGIDP